MQHKRTVFFLSDRTGITAENLGHTLLTQFDTTEFKQMTLPFINTPDKARAAVDYVNQVAQESGKRPIIFSTTVNDEIRGIVRGANALFLDLFDTYLGSIEQELHLHATHVEGRAHGLADREAYRTRMDAMNYALHHDDGATTRDFAKADVILIAPSRCGKTPTCIYLAMQYGVYAANYPLTEEDLEKTRLPATLTAHKGKLYGLIINPERLSQVRGERRPGSRYASLQQASYELRQAELLYKQHALPYLDSTSMSIEEMAVTIMQEKKLKRHSYA